MRRIISLIYGVLLIAIWICVMGIVIAVLDSGGPNWLLAVAGFVATVSSVALVEELLEWRPDPKAEGQKTTAAAHKDNEFTSRAFDTGKLVTDDTGQ
jgi:thiol:disulfide interchange protein